MDVRGWRAWYADGNVYASDEYDWTSLPLDGILGVVVYREPPYRKIVDGGDWYYLEDGCPTATETHDEWGKWVDPPDVPDEIIKRSSSRIPEERFKAIQTEMVEAKTWP